jgi:hypothetical protein
MAERVGFEPTWDYRPQPISSRCRCGRFGTSPKTLILTTNALSNEPSACLGRTRVVTPSVRERASTVHPPLNLAGDGGWSFSWGHDGCPGLLFVFEAQLRRARAAKDTTE